MNYLTFSEECNDNFREISLNATAKSTAEIVTSGVKIIHFVHQLKTVHKLTQKRNILKNIKIILNFHILCCL